MKVKLNLGDWSEDGHGKCDSLILEVNKDVSEIRQGYKDSCKLVGVQFNHNENYAGLQRTSRTPLHIWTEYEDSYISEEAMECLIESGLFKDEEEYCQKYEDYPERLIMDFIKLSLPDLEYEFLDDEIPSINGFWNDELNCQIGYGLYYG